MKETNMDVTSKLMALGELNETENVAVLLCSHMSIVRSYDVFYYWDMKITITVLSLHSFRPPSSNEISGIQTAFLRKNNNVQQRA